ncbi:MAG: DUF5320 domain-containing protein [Desulfosarcinaceae bacterium]
MPRGDRTGPTGMGAMTGRGAGYCSGINLSGLANPAARFGRGMGTGRGAGFRGQGGGRGRCNWFYGAGMAPRGPYGGSVPAADPAMGKDVLKKQAEMLQAQLDAIRKQLGETEDE